MQNDDQVAVPEKERKKSDLEDARITPLPAKLKQELEEDTKSDAADEADEELATTEKEVEGG